MQGINITKESSVKEGYKACEEVLRPDKHAKNRMKLKKEGEIVENTKDLIKMFNEFFRNKPEKLVAEVVKDPNIDPLQKLREK